MLECREALFRWGLQLPPRDNVHTWTRLRFTFAADTDLKAIGGYLDSLNRLRNRADYDLSAMPEFSSEQRAQLAVRNVDTAIQLLDAIETDPVRRTAAITAIRKAFP